MENLDPNVIFLWRAIERLANVLIGALAIYLGYRLFTNLPDKRQDENGKLKLMLPGDISVYVSRVGPGIFFALFGSAIILTSMVSTVDLSMKSSSSQSHKPTDQVSYQGVKPDSMTKHTIPKTKLVTNHVSYKKPKSGTSQLNHSGDDSLSSEISYVTDAVDVDAISHERDSVKKDLQTLGKLEQALNYYLEDPQNNQPQLTSEDASTLLNALLRVKSTMMLSVWDEQWGDAELFSQWVKDGALEPLPVGAIPATQLFLGQSITQ